MPTSSDETGPTNPGSALVPAVERVLALAATWLAWDGRPRLAADGERAYTPHKAIRRTADHIVDHLAQAEALLAGAPAEEDRWHASAVTLDADRASFSEADLVEAQQRLRRLARTFELRYAAAGPEAWDAPQDGWTLRQIAEHVADPWYAEQLGDLSGP
ncbi:MAG TPA: hypothetical protein VFB94_12085 [Acidimicrobiales bacterium]|jgi:hypothetical protein|nr:hypothetical protein [Acidimicrobiales bacterium]